MRRLKGVRKLKSIHNRAACLKHIHSVFQKSYIASTGTPKNRLETACKAVDDVLRAMINSDMAKKSFYLIVMDDFKKYLIDVSENEALIERAINAAQPQGILV